VQVLPAEQVTHLVMRSGQPRHVCEPRSKAILGFGTQATQIVGLLQFLQLLRKLPQGSHWNEVGLTVKVLGLHREQIVGEKQFRQWFINSLHNWHWDVELMVYVLLVHKVHWVESKHRTQNDIALLQELQVPFER